MAIGWTISRPTREPSTTNGTRNAAVASAAADDRAELLAGTVLDQLAAGLARPVVLELLEAADEHDRAAHGDREGAQQAEQRAERQRRPVDERRRAPRRRARPAA